MENAFFIQTLCYFYYKIGNIEEFNIFARSYNGIDTLYLSTILYYVTVEIKMY